MTGDDEQQSGAVRMRFGPFGGRYVPETLWTPLEEVAGAYEEARRDEEYRRCEREWLLSRLGRPTALSALSSLTGHVGGAQLWAKREDLCEGGSFCVTSAIAQGLLAQWMGREMLLGETATGDFGVALGTVGAALGLEMTIFMQRNDLEAEPLQVARMRRLGVKVVPVAGAVAGRRQAMAEALRSLSLVSDRAFYATSSLASPAPYPEIVGEALSIIGRECRRQLSERSIEPEYVVAPVGSGTFAAGLFQGFVGSSNAQLVGVQAGSEASGNGQFRGADSMVRGRPGVYLGTRSLVLQDQEGQIDSTHTAASGMAMPVAGPQHAHWLQQGKAHYVTISDKEAMNARRLLTHKEGIFACQESGYDLAYTLKLAATLDGDQHIVVGISGSGIRDLDVDDVSESEEQ